MIKKSKEALWQTVLHMFPELDVYETKDLFRKHSTKGGLWAYAGHSDDIVVLSNGANINASTVQEKLM